MSTASASAKSRVLCFVSLFCSAAVFLAPGAFGQTTPAPQPKVLAPHKPVAPSLGRPKKWAKPMVAQSLVGGLWTIDANFKSSLYLRNDVKTDPVTVTPTLYLSNGVQYTLAPVKLDPSGTAVVDINQALAAQGIAPYATLSGYVQLQYQWPWAAICAMVRNIDTVHSLIFSYAFQPPPSDSAIQPSPGSGQQLHSLEGMWWKQENNITGFVALSNVTSQPVNATVQVTDAANHDLGDHSVIISPHGTKTVSLLELLSAATTSGGIAVSHDGPVGGLLINGGLEDEATGYSAHLPLVPLPDASGKASNDSFAELGLMNGAADPMMSFPAGTVFKPYSVLRNVSNQPIPVTPTLWWMEGAAAHSAPLSPFTVSPHQTQYLDVSSLISSAGPKNFNGSVNLVLAAQEKPGALLMASGSVDQKNTYVFEVMPRGILESISKTLGYWSTANGDDTMVTLWNPADESQDFVFTLFFAGGHSGYPIHLGPRATQVFNVSEIVRNPAPDSEGNVIPASVHEGSAEISGSQGETEHILLALDAGLYNVQKATCGPPCTTCNGLVSSSVEASPFDTAVGGGYQLTFAVQYNTGQQYDRTSSGNWSSSNTSVATVSSGLAQGVSAGSLTASVQDLIEEPVYGNACYISCPIAYAEPGGSAPGNTFDGVLTPQDNFSGRSTSRFGIAEVINLSFTSQTTAAALGGLQWTIVSGGGSLSNAGTDGKGTYTGPGTAATVVLRLAIVSGSSQGQKKDYTLTIVTPSGGLLSKFTNIRHTQGYISVGFEGHGYLLPTDVSFANLEFAEGTAVGQGSGFYAFLNGEVHEPTSPTLSIANCDSVIGCEIIGADEVDSGDNPPPFSTGDFLWPVPWQYQAPGGSLTTFTTANHHMTADQNGNGTISKAGAGPYSKNASDPTTSY